MDTNSRNTLIKIMVFYSLLSYFIAPTAGYYFLGKNCKSSVKARKKKMTRLPWSKEETAAVER